MKTFMNRNFTADNQNCTKVMFCQSDVAPNDNYIEVDELMMVMSRCEQLYRQGNAVFFGRM